MQSPVNALYRSSPPRTRGPARHFPIRQSDAFVGVFRVYTYLVVHRLIGVYLYVGNLKVVVVTVVIIDLSLLRQREQLVFVI